MSTETTPLLFPEVLAARYLQDLKAGHGLTQAELDWLQNASLSSHTLRQAQTPQMIAETILLAGDSKPPIPLAGCFALRRPAQDDGSQGDPAFLYTPWDGIKRFDAPKSLEDNIAQVLRKPLERDKLFSLLSMVQRSELNGAIAIQQSRRTIDGDIFKTQIESIEDAQDLNASSMVKELIALPSLVSMVDQALKEVLPNLDPRQIRIALTKTDQPQAVKPVKVTESIALSDAVLVYFHNRGWPAGHDIDLTHPGSPASSYTAQAWETKIRETATKLIPKLTDCITEFWDALGPLYITRRKFLSQVIHDRLLATIFVERDKEGLTDAQSGELLRLLRPSRRDEPLLSIETVRLWEYEPNYVELAGSLKISGKENYLVTPHQGLLKVNSYLDFKETLFDTDEQKNAIYELLSLDERNRFLQFDQPQISGKPINLPVAESLANTIIDKQRVNLRYALEMSRQAEVDIHALVDKALDIRAFIHKDLLKQTVTGHWGTQPTFYGKLRPSTYMADQMQRKATTYEEIESGVDELLTRMPITKVTDLSVELDKLRTKLTSAFSFGIRAEAELRASNATLPSIVNELIETVFEFDNDYPQREDRKGVRGFRPDVYSLRLSCKSNDVTVFQSLANCFLLTERGGLDTPHSGMAILWTPADGLQAFSSVEVATQQLNRQLLDCQRRFGLLVNLKPAERKPHRHYQLEDFELVTGNVLLNRMNSFISHLVAEYGYLSTLKIGNSELTPSELNDGLKALLKNGAPTNLKRALSIARAYERQQKLPAWLGTAPLEEQRLHIEILEQYRNSTAEGKDYLDGIESLRSYVQKRLKTLMDARFPGKKLNPETIQITPRLAIVGPACSLTDFALQHKEVTEKDFTVSSTSTEKLPDGFNEAAVRALLSSLDISTTYKTSVSRVLTGDAGNVQPNSRRFAQQLPWQLLQYAHARYLQQYLSPAAFDLVRQVLDMPDAIARRAVKGTQALIRPLELITTQGATAVKALGLYLISSSTAPTGSHILYSPYYEGHQLTEFKDEASVVAAFNQPGLLQNLLIRRLPEAQQATFKNLFAATLGQTSEITLASNPINTNTLDEIYSDNAKLISNLFTSQNQDNGSFDWSTVVHLLSSGAKLIRKDLPAKLNFLETLRESYEDFKASSEALQEHDYKAGLYDFIAGAAEMVSLGFLNRDDTFGLLDPIEPSTSNPASSAWKDIASTSANRTDLQVFEATNISLANLKKNAVDGTFRSLATSRLYVPLAGKVYQVAKYNQTWRIVRGESQGPLLKRSSDGKTWVIDTERQTIHFGKAASKLSVVYSDLRAKGELNIEARGMAEIQRKYPSRAKMIMQALETARFYTSNALHNLERLKRLVLPGSRMDTYLTTMFGVNSVDAKLLGKIEKAISPICRALANPTWGKQNGERFVVGHLKYLEDRATAFVFDGSGAKRIYLTQFFFHMELGWYRSAVPQPFDVDAHGQGAVIIHEMSHLLTHTIDIIYLDTMNPFLDLISTVSHLGQKKYDEQKELQEEGLSLATPKSKLFTDWDETTNTYKSIDQLPGHKEVAREVLKTTGTRNMDAARDAFLDPTSADKRIDVILRNADSITLLICELGRQLDPSPPH